MLRLFILDILYILLFMTKQLIFLIKLYKNYLNRMVRKNIKIQNDKILNRLAVSKILPCLLKLLG